MKKYSLAIFCLLIIVYPIFAQLDDKTEFSSTQDNICRYSTSQKDLDSELFLPQYNDLASNPNLGITLSDWNKSFLSIDRFFHLDINGDEIVSRDEINQDSAMGEVIRYEQNLADVSKYKDLFPDYNQQLKKLPLTQKPEEKIAYFLAKKSKEEKIPTKTYIQLKQGQQINKKVDLGTYSYLQLKNIQEEQSLNLQIYGLAILLITAIVSFLTLAIVQSKQNNQAII